MKMKKESYERSALNITKFSDEDVIVTSNPLDEYSKFFTSFGRDNDSSIFQNR